MFPGKIDWAGDRKAGDCSIRVLDASDVDDGEWECQVTASSFTEQDALTSNIARLVVRGKSEMKGLTFETNPSIRFGKSAYSLNRGKVLELVFEFEGQKRCCNLHFKSTATLDLNLSSKTRRKQTLA